MDISKVDLNLLVSFEAVYEERSVTRAAQRMGVTQPAMSATLRRMRGLFDDRLFVRRGRELVPTARAIALSTRIAAALGAIRTLWEGPRFDPSHSERRFSIACTDYIETVLLPILHHRLARFGGRLTIVVRRVPTMFGIPADTLTSGAVDLAIGLFPMPLPPQAQLQGQRLFRDKWVAVMRHNHPSAARSLSIRRFAALPHVPVSYPPEEGPGMTDFHLAQHGLTRIASATSTNFSSALFFVAATDSVTVIPERLVSIFKRALAIRAVPVPTGAGHFDVNMVWHSRTQSDPALMWLRSETARCAASLGAPDPPIDDRRLKR